MGNSFKKKCASFSEEMASQLFSELIATRDSTHHTHQQGRKSMAMAVVTKKFMSPFWKSFSLRIKTVR